MSSIETAGLELVLLDPLYLACRLAGIRTPDLGFIDPAGFLDGADDLIALRLEQLESNPRDLPWLLRAVVARADRVAVGFIGFHDGPLADTVEIGYEIHPRFRRHGYASEASAALIAWAAQRGIRIVRAAIAPDNTASLAVLSRQGFAQVGEQIDPEDGRELVFEKVI